MKSTILWKVTGRGGKKDRYGRYELFQTVEVKADTKAEAIEAAKALLKPEKQIVIEAKEYCHVRV